MSVQILSIGFAADGSGTLEVIVESPNTPTVHCNGTAIANVVSIGGNKWKATKPGPFPPGSVQIIEVLLPGTQKAQRATLEIARQDDT